MQSLNLSTVFRMTASSEHPTRAAGKLPSLVRTSYPLLSMTYKHGLIRTPGLSPVTAIICKTSEM